MKTDCAQDVLKFWFEELDEKDRFRKSEQLDAQIRTQFETVFMQVEAGETWHWRDTATGRLAEIIVLDQFTRNMYRNTPRSFASDPMALALAQEAVRQNCDSELSDVQRAFLYMPYMHSESRKVHEQAMLLFQNLPNLEYEIRHKAIIDQFGRYPYRNAILARESTDEEQKWLQNNNGF
ncbi:MAG: DUF924 family protein [Granulosicoccus sp.]